MPHKLLVMSHRSHKIIVTDDSCLTIEQCVIAHKLWAMSHPSIIRGGYPHKSNEELVT